MAIRIAALAVLGPVMALRRWWWRRRRGAAVRSSVRPGPPARGGALARLDWILDVPGREERAARRRVTAALVGLAAALGRPGDVYHLIHRTPWDDEAEFRAVGPLLQALGDRLHGHLGREPLEGRTALWPVLERGIHLALVADAATVDPDAPGEPDGIVGALPCRWAFAVAWRRERASTVFRVAVWAPPEAMATVRSHLERA